MNGLLEILTTKKWMVSPEYIHTMRKALEHNLNGHVPFSSEKKSMGRMVDEDGDVVSSFLIGEDGEYAGSSWTPQEVKVPFVNVLDVSGPITRNGGGCSYGSIDHRDMMMTAADSELCRGHVFIINTPGGSAWAKNDYQQAIDYAKAKGQPVIAFIDGMCASAGMYLASLCDERYFMHPKDEIGCIGVMAAFYTEKNGEKNEYTNETYHELYDPQSFDKNKWARDIANNDDDALLIKELSQLGVEFRNDVKKACPRAKDFHLKGRVFDAESVKGILVDDQATLAKCIERAFNLFNGVAEPIDRNVSLTDDELDDNGADDPNDDKKKCNNSINNNIMKEKYEKLASACGVEELAVNEEGTHLALDLCDALNAKLDSNDAALAQADEKINELNAEIEKMKADCEKTIADNAESLNVNFSNERDSINEAHAKEIDALKAENLKEVETLNGEIENLKKELNETNGALTSAQQTIADRDEQIKALVSIPAQEVTGSPASNGMGAQMECNGLMPAYDHNKSFEENARIRTDWHNAHR